LTRKKQEASKQWLPLRLCEGLHPFASVGLILCRRRAAAMTMIGKQ
jgi:hypothetical protein